MKLVNHIIHSDPDVVIEEFISSRLYECVQKIAINNIIYAVAETTWYQFIVFIISDLHETN